VKVEAASIDTGSQDRDKHLRSADFLDVETFPELTFRSTRVQPHGKDRFTLVGSLALHGVTRELTLEGEVGGRGKDPWGNERAGFAARTHLHRKDFGLQWNQALETGGVLVADRVDVEVEIEAFRPAAQ
jgi:polyisoprenoid-binding protein YceI